MQLSDGGVRWVQFDPPALTGKRIPLQSPSASPRFWQGPLPSGRDRFDRGSSRRVPYKSSRLHYQAAEIASTVPRSIRTRAALLSLHYQAAEIASTGGHSKPTSDLARAGRLRALLSLSHCHPNMDSTTTMASRSFPIPHNNLHSSSAIPARHPHRRTRGTRAGQAVEALLRWRPPYTTSSGRSAASTISRRAWYLS